MKHNNSIVSLLVKNEVRFQVNKVFVSLRDLKIVLINQIFVKVLIQKKVFKKMATESVPSVVTESQEQLKNFWAKTMEDIKNMKAVCSLCFHHCI